MIGGVRTRLFGGCRCSGVICARFRGIVGLVGCRVLRVVVLVISGDRELNATDTLHMR
jgi:hypothetical protein